MNILIVTAYTIAAYFIFRTLQQIILVRNSLAYVEKFKILKSTNNTRKPLIIIIPVYKEAAVILDSITYFKKIANNKNIFVYYITTSKEAGKSSNNTYQIIKRNTNDFVNVLHYPYEEGNKSDQINYWADYLKNKFGGDVYIGIFDADSRPNIDGLTYIQTDEDSPVGYQMFSIYSELYEHVSHLSKASAVFQTRWTLSFEIPRVVKNYYSKKKRLMYMIGHGMFVKLSVLSKNKLPAHTITEDLSYGYFLSALGKYWKPVPFFDYCTVPDNSIGAIKQSGRWFYGELFMYKDFLRGVAKNDYFKITNLARLLGRYFLSMQWLFGPILLAYSLCVAVINAQYALFMLLVIGIFLYVYFLHKSIRRFFAVNFITYIFIFIKSVLNMFGPVYTIYRVAISKVTKHPYDFDKTARHQDAN